MPNMTIRSTSENKSEVMKREMGKKVAKASVAAANSHATEDVNMRDVTTVQVTQTRATRATAKGTGTATTVTEGEKEATRKAEATTKDAASTETPTATVVEQYTDPDPQVDVILKAHKDDYERLSNGRIRCKLTGMEMVCTPPIVESYYKGRAYRRAKARVIDPPPSLEQYAPYIISHKFSTTKAYCRLTKTTLNWKLSEIEAHMKGRRYQVQYKKILERKKKREEWEARRKHALETNDPNDVFGRLPDELLEEIIDDVDEDDFDLSDDGQPVGGDEQLEASNDEAEADEERPDEESENDDHALENDEHVDEDVAEIEKPISAEKLLKDNNRASNGMTTKKQKRIHETTTDEATPKSTKRRRSRR